MYVLITTKLNALITPGTIYTKNELNKPRLRIRKKEGISPALIYMERMIINVNGFVRTNSLLDRAKDNIEVKNTLVTTFITVLDTDIKNACGIAPVWKIT